MRVTAILHGTATIHFVYRNGTSCAESDQRAINSFETNDLAPQTMPVQ